jgi:hypothetical protein
MDNWRSYEPGREHERYSLCCCSASAEPEWQNLLAILLPYIYPLLQQLLPQGYKIKVVGGDAVYGKHEFNQDLHGDGFWWRESSLEFACTGFLVISVCTKQISLTNGPLRFIPKPHMYNFHRGEKECPPPALGSSDEADLFASVPGGGLVPMEVGDVFIRDAAVWHAGSSNFESHTRFLPGFQAHCM